MGVTTGWAAPTTERREISDDADGCLTSSRAPCSLLASSQCVIVRWMSIVVLWAHHLPLARGSLHVRALLVVAGRLAHVTGDLARHTAFPLAPTDRCIDCWPHCARRCAWLDPDWRGRNPR